VVDDDDDVVDDDVVDDDVVGCNAVDDGVNNGSLVDGSVFEGNAADANAKPADVDDCRLEAGKAFFRFDSGFPDFLIFGFIAAWFPYRFCCRAPAPLNACIVQCAHSRLLAAAFHETGAPPAGQGPANPGRPHAGCGGAPKKPLSKTRNTFSKLQTPNAHLRRLGPHGPGRPEAETDF
jgi:hypothetical protein